MKHLLEIGVSEESLELLSGVNTTYFVTFERWLVRTAPTKDLNIHELSHVCSISRLEG